MQRLLVALCVGVAAMAGVSASAATTPSPSGAVSATGPGGPHRPPPPKCQTGYTLKWSCTKTVPTPRPKHFPKNQPWLGEKCVKHGWVCEPPIK